MGNNFNLCNMVYCVFLIDHKEWKTIANHGHLVPFSTVAEIYMIKASLVVQWLGICLAMQWTPFRSLVQGQSDMPMQQLTPCGTATKLTCPNNWSPCTVEPLLHNKRSHCNQKPACCNWRAPLISATRESRHAATDSAATNRCIFKRNIPDKLEKWWNIHPLPWGLHL